MRGGLLQQNCRLMVSLRSLVTLVLSGTVFLVTESNHCVHSGDGLRVVLLETADDPAFFTSVNFCWSADFLNSFLCHLHSILKPIQRIFVVVVLGAAISVLKFPLSEKKFQFLCLAIIAVLISCWIIPVFGSSWSCPLLIVLSLANGCSFSSSLCNLGLSSEHECM